MWADNWISTRARKNNKNNEAGERERARAAVLIAHHQKNKKPRILENFRFSLLNYLSKEKEARGP